MDTNTIEAELERQRNCAFHKIDLALTALRQAKQELLDHETEWAKLQQQYPSYSRKLGDELGKQQQEIDEQNMRLQKVLCEKLVLIQEKSLSGAKKDYERDMARHARVTEAIRRYNQDKHAIEVARIELYVHDGVFQSLLEKHIRMLQRYESEIAAGNESYVTRRDRRQRYIELDNALYVGGASLGRAVLQDTEKAAETSKEEFNSTARCWLWKW